MNAMESKIKFIKGERIYLRPILKCDFPEMLVWMNDWSVLGGLTMRLPMTEQKEMEWIEKYTVQDRVIVLAIVLNNGTLIGSAGFHNIDWINRTGVSGSCLKKEYWGKGYGSEAKMLMLQYAFYELNLRKITSEVFGNNSRSIAMQKKCGGVLEGRLKKQVYKNGEYVDELIFAIFKEDFEKNNPLVVSDPVVSDSEVKKQSHLEQNSHPRSFPGIYRF